MQILRRVRASSTQADDPRWRRIILLSLSAIVSILIVLAVIGWAASIWVHSSHSASVTDPLAEVGDVLTFGTLLLALIAGLVALRVYAISTGRPELKFRILFRDQHFNKPIFQTIKRGELDRKIFRKVQLGHRDNFAAGKPWEKTAYIWVKNDSKYPARSPVVIVTLGPGMAIFRPRVKPNRIMAIFEPRAKPTTNQNQDWRDIELRSSGVDVLAMQWDGGTEYPIHANSTRRLPDLSFEGVHSRVSATTGVYPVAVPVPGSGSGAGAGSARDRTDRDGDGRCSRAWRGDLEGDAGRPGDDDAAGESGEARPAYRQPDRVPRNREESLA